jgi:hypothetical protein
MTDLAAVSERLQFQLRTVAPTPDENEVRRLLKEALAEASAEARQSEGVDFEARAEIRGAFGGIGEFVAVLAFLGKAFAGGVAAAGGKHFFDRYLKKALERRGLFPSEPEGPAEAKP